MKLWDYQGHEIVEMPVDAVGLLVLEAFGSDGWNVDTFFKNAQYNDSGLYGQPGVPAKLADAWSWLESRGLIGFNHEQSSSANARRMTTAGQQALLEGLERLRAGQRLDVDLHSTIAAVAPRQFLVGEFELAAFSAMKAVEVRVRELCGSGDGKVGVNLMTEAFNPKTLGPLVDVDAEGGEQEAVMALFRGAIGTFKNPSSHRTVRYEDATFASEVVLLADLLMRLLDRAEERLNS